MADFNWNEQHRQQVLQGRQILERTSASLARSNQIAIETEHTGHEVINELEVQRESLLRSQRRLENANDDLSKSGAILRAMKRNLLYNKLILIMIIVMEVVILAGLIALKFM